MMYEVNISSKAHSKSSLVPSREKKKTMENYLSISRVVDVNVMKSYQTRSLMKCYCTVLIKKNVYIYIHVYKQKKI